MLSAPSSISSFSRPSPSAGGRRSRLSTSLLTGGKSARANNVAAAIPTSRKYYNSNPSRSFDDSSALLSGRTTPSEHGGASSMSMSSIRRVYVSDQELCFRANQVHNSLDFDALTNLTINTWAWKKNHREFTLFAMDADAERRHEVLAAGDLNCSLEELISILHLATVPEYNATMKRLLEKDFIYGSIVHAIGPETSRTPAMTPGALDPCSSLSMSGGSGSSSSSSAGSSSANSMGNYVAVKTSTFVRSNLFARNEEWCFLESFERSAESDNFLLSQSTIDAEELRAGRAPQSRVDQLRDITTAFYVEKIPRTRGAVRLFFHGKYDGGLNSYINTKGVAPPKAAKSRLMTLAKGVSRISDLVRRRRLGLQKMANRTAFNAAKNTRCTCCTKGLHLFTKKKRCFLCAYYVCDKCWTQQKMEACNGKTSSILICTRCLECVDACEYSDVCSQDRKKYLIRVEPDGDDSGRGGGRNNNSDQPTSEPTGKALLDILEQSLGDTDELIKSAAMSVIRHILNQDSFEDVINEESYYTRDNPKSSFSTRPSMMIRDDGLQSERDHVEALARHFELEQPTPLSECVLANAESRSYPICVPENPATTVPDHPVPENEAQRLLRIQENNFLSLGEVAELNIICSLAAEELHCAISMVTVIDAESELILACNNLDLHRTKMARNQTFCSHLIMDNKPLLIRNPEADVRFHNMDAVKKSGVRFYCGFPVVARDGTVVGSVCCLDFEQRSLTRSQYSMMKKLAKTASKVIQAKGRSFSGRRTMGGTPSPP